MVPRLHDTFAGGEWEEGLLWPCCFLFLTSPCAAQIQLQSRIPELSLGLHVQVNSADLEREVLNAEALLAAKKHNSLLALHDLATATSTSTAQSIAALVSALIWEFLLAVVSLTPYSTVPQDALAESYDVMQSLHSEEGMNGLTVDGDVRGRCEILAFGQVRFGWLVILASPIILSYSLSLRSSPNATAA